MVHPADLLVARQKWQQAITSGQPFQMQYRFRHRDGEYRWMLTQALPIPDEKGEITEWIGTATDIHEQKTAFDLLYTLLEGIPHMAWTSVPEKSSINFYNKQWYEYSGLTPEQSLGQGWQQVTHREDIPSMMERILQGRAAGLPWEVESRYRRSSDGMYRWHLSRAVPIRDDAGNITLWIGTATDIHEHKIAQYKLEDALKELHEKNFELDQFVYKTSHDLRAPLTTIMGLISLSKQEPEPATRASYLDLIENRVYKQDSFIRSMLDHSRNTRTATKPEKIRLEPFIRERIGELEYMRHFNRLRINLRIGVDELFTDAFRLKIIISNLVSNAIKYQDLNKSESTLTILVQPFQEQTEVVFTDNGIGIASEYQDQLFSMFFRASEHSEGSGLGLYIIKQAVSALNGSIRLESKPRAGTTFAVRLPSL